MKDSELALALPIRFKDIYNQYQKVHDLIRLNEVLIIRHSTSGVKPLFS